MDGKIKQIVPIRSTRLLEKKLHSSRKNSEVSKIHNPVSSPLRFGVGRFENVGAEGYTLGREEAIWHTFIVQGARPASDLEDHSVKVTGGNHVSRDSSGHCHSNVLRQGHRVRLRPLYDGLIFTGDVSSMDPESGDTKSLMLIDFLFNRAQWAGRGVASKQPYSRWCRGSAVVRVIIRTTLFYFT